MNKKIIIMLLCSLLIASFSFSAWAGSATPAKTDAISRYPVPKIEDLPPDIQKILLSAKEKRGFIPNVLRGLAHRPDELRAFLAYAKAVMGKKSGLSAAEKEMIIVAHSSHNACTYCVASHGAALRKLTGDPAMSEKIAINYHEADISPRQKAMIDFAMKVTTSSHAIEERDFALLAEHGFSREDAWDIASITAFFNLSNRMMNFAKIRPDEEYYTQGYSK